MTSSRTVDLVSRVLRVVFLLSALTLAQGALAHDARPAYLQIDETTPGRYQVLWRTPVLSGMRLPVMLKLPDAMRNLTEPALQELSDSLVERRLVEADRGGLVGRPHRVPRAPGNDHRRARAHRAPRRHSLHHVGEAVAAVGRDHRLEQAARRRGRLSRPRRRAHPARLRSPALRARADPDRSQHARPADDHHRVHARALDHPRSSRR